jgi:hypothetical protein
MQGMRNLYAYGYQLTANGGDPIATFNAFMIATPTITTPSTPSPSLVAAS